MKRKYTQKELFDKTRELWSLSSQIRMLAEESTELALASLKLSRFRESSSYGHKGSEKKEQKLIDHLAEEIADTEFLIAEMLYYFKIVPLVAKHRKAKEERLEQRIRAYEGTI